MDRVHKTPNQIHSNTINEYIVDEGDKKKTNKENSLEEKEMRSEVKLNKNLHSNAEKMLAKNLKHKMTAEGIHNFFVEYLSSDPAFKEKVYKRLKGTSIHEENNGGDNSFYDGIDLNKLANMYSRPIQDCKNVDELTDLIEFMATNLAYKKEKDGQTKYFIGEQEIFPYTKGERRQNLGRGQNESSTIGNKFKKKQIASPATISLWNKIRALKFSSFVVPAFTYKKSNIQELLPNAKKLRECSLDDTLHSDFSIFAKEIDKLHEAGIVHSDMHSANIVIADNRPTLVDFDECRTVSDVGHCVFIKKASEEFSKEIEKYLPELKNKEIVCNDELAKIIKDYAPPKYTEGKFSHLILVKDAENPQNNHSILYMGITKRIGYSNTFDQQGVEEKEWTQNLSLDEFGFERPDSTEKYSFFYNLIDSRLDPQYLPEELKEKFLSVNGFNIAEEIKLLKNEELKENFIKANIEELINKGYLNSEISIDDYYAFYSRKKIIQSLGELVAK